MPSRSSWELAFRTARCMQVLVVEDQELLSDLIADGVASDSEVLRATTVAEGVELLMAAAVEAVLLDCVLPGDARRQMVLESDHQQVPAVLMTGDPRRWRRRQPERGRTFSSHSACRI